MKILTAAQSREADAFTIKHEPIASIDLMERAAKGCVEKLKADIPSSFRFCVFCGLGNNGGDGLAIARLLAADGFDVNVFIVRHASKCSDDFIINEQRLKQTGCMVQDLYPDKPLPVFGEQFKKTIIVDAILGTGLRKPLEGFLAALVKHINNSLQHVVAIDMPTGLFADNAFQNNNDAVIQAAETLTIGSPKLAFMFPESAPYVGNFTVIPIGLDQTFIDSLSGKNYFLTATFIKSILKPRKKFAHKGNFGHALLVAGTYGKMGAAVLSAKACLSAGTGLLTVHIPRCGYEILQHSAPEAMCSIDASDYFISDNIHLDQYNAVGIGPGLGREKQSANVLKLLIQNSGNPMVIDADAINIIADNKTWLAFIPKGSIFTPHPKEFERLAGKTSDSFDRFELQRTIAQKYGIYVVLKGAHTAIASPDGRVYFNSTGNPGMATGGSGDVLTGILTALLAQGYDPGEACILGTYLHGLAGDIALNETGGISLVAGDIIDKIQNAYAHIMNLHIAENNLKA